MEVVMIETFNDGFFDIQFVGEDKPRRSIPIDHAVVDTYGLPLYLVGPDGTVWNWSTIIRAKRISPSPQASNEGEKNG